MNRTQIHLCQRGGRLAVTLRAVVRAVHTQALQLQKKPLQKAAIIFILVHLTQRYHVLQFLFSL